MRTIFLLVILLAACSPTTSDTVPGRWYTAKEVERGAALYQRHCATCHRDDGGGTVDWRTPDPNGNYPPPPLNGTAHTWHHPMSVLDATIADGGAGVGGVMPGFAAALDEEDRRAIIAWFQDLWSEDIYRRWQEIDARSVEP